MLNNGRSWKFFGLQLFFDLCNLLLCVTSRQVSYGLASKYNYFEPDNYYFSFLNTVLLINGVYTYGVIVCVLRLEW